LFTGGGIRTSIYRLGDYDTSRSEEFKINIDNPIEQPLIEEYVNRSYIKRIPNDITNNIMSGLGTSQFAVVVLTTDVMDTFKGKFQLRHGNNIILSSAGKDDADNHIYTYLVFRQSPTSKTPIFIPISRDKSLLWDYATGKNGKAELAVNETSLKNYITNLCTNIRICTQKNAIRNGNLIKIREQSTNNLPICNINVYTSGFDS
jgi:hypothetical protein